METIECILTMKLLEREKQRSKSKSRRLDVMGDGERERRKKGMEAAGESFMSGLGRGWTGPCISTLTLAYC